MITVLLRKEGLENWRNKKWIWVPLVFILLAIMDPITNYYLPGNYRICSNTSKRVNVT